MGVHFAMKALKSPAEAALGVKPEISSITVGFSTLEGECIRVADLTGKTGIAIEGLVEVGSTTSGVGMR